LAIDGLVDSSITAVDLASKWGFQEGGDDFLVMIVISR